MNDHICKHFIGYTSIEDKGCCAAGVCYRDVTPLPDEPGSGLRRPCNTKPFSEKPHHLAEFEKRGVCEKMELPTADELEEQERSWERALDRIKKIGPLVSEIKKTHKGRNWQGLVDCPCCGKKVAISHAAVNGHVWAKCETENCINFME